jgi:hypothetical protein
MTRAAAAWKELGTHPPGLHEDPQQPRLLRLAAYVAACTEPTDRLFVLGMYPELYYFSNRLFAGGHAWLLPFYYSGDREERHIVERLERARVPVVVTETESTYEGEYRPVFDQVDSYLQRHYEQAGEIDVGAPQPLRVLVRRDHQVFRRYEPLDLPCFTRT